MMICGHSGHGHHGPSRCAGHRRRPRRHRDRLAGLYHARPDLRGSGPTTLAARTFGPGASGPGRGTIGGEAFRGFAPRPRRGPTMKLITWTAIATATAVTVALIAGKDDIRKFRRMRSM